MSEQPSALPPPLPISAEPPPIPASQNEWYYVREGAKQGPVSASHIGDLLARNQIEMDGQVWRKGMTEWKSIRESDLAYLVASAPPAIATHLIGNGYVWTLAILPLVIGIIDASIAQSNQEAAARSLVLGFPYNPGRELPWIIPTLINSILGWLDERRLRKAGYGSNWLLAAAVLFVPAYLFARARRLKQRPTYAIFWLITVVVALLLEGAANS